MQTAHFNKLASCNDIDAAIFILDNGKSANNRLTRKSNTVILAELVHRALISRAGGGKRIDCPELIGQDTDGNTLRGGHRHAHILPLDIDGDDYNDHILVWSPMGFGEISLSAIKSLQNIWGKKGKIELSLISVTSLDKLKYDNESKAALKISDLLLGAGKQHSIWYSATPYVPPRYVKPRGKKNDLSYQINMELAARGLVGADVYKLPVEDNRELLDSFVIKRQSSFKPPQNTCYALKLEFSVPVSGPLCLGYASHFGLGIFQLVK